MTYTEWNAGIPSQPAQPADPAAGQPVPPQPEPKSGLKKLLAVGGPIVGAGLVGVASLTGFFGAGDPEVGDCVQENGDSWDVVDCGSAEAQFKVIGVEGEQQSYNDFQDDPKTCTDFPKAQFFMWIGPDGALGTVYCAQPL
jgi:hypothetical protein